MECTIGGVDCTITGRTAGQVDVQFSAVSYGTLDVLVYNSHGKLQSNNGAQTIQVTAQHVTVSPTHGTLFGGTAVTLSGIGVGLGDNIVIFGNIEAKTISRQRDKMIVETPAGDAAGNVPVGFINGVQFTAFDYTTNTDISISLSKTDFSVKGEGSIIISFSQILTRVVEVLIEGESFGHFDLVNTDTLDFSIPPHAAGKGMKFKVHVSNHGFTNSVNVRYRLTISNVSPSSSSTAGGAMITISGRGFGKIFEDVEVTLADRTCKIISLTNREIVCQTTSYYREHQVYLTGESWFPQKLTVNQNDIINWHWLTEVPINVQIQSVNSMSETSGNGLFTTPKIQSSSGVVNRFMVESPGVYYYTSGFLDQLFSQFANGEITVEQAVDYQVDVTVKVVGFDAMVENASKKSGDRNILRSGKTCIGAETDLTGKDPSVMDPGDCPNMCLNHLYSYQRTPTATNSTFDATTGILSVKSESFLEHDGCPNMFEISGWSEYGNVAFVVNSRVLK